MREGQEGETEVDEKGYTIRDGGRDVAEMVACF